MEWFLRRLPKVELHAHLNGSLNSVSIRELNASLFGKNSPDFLRLCEEFITFEDNEMRECFKKFKFVHKLTTTQRGLHLATMLAIRDFANDNVVYLELRTTPKKSKEMSKLEYLCCVLDAIEAAMREYNIIVKLLPSIDRAQSIADAEDTLEIVHKLRNEYPGIIPAIDFSGNPDSGNFSKFIKVLEKARFNDLKLSVHCGEINNPSEVAEMLEFGMERCGHGTFLSDKQIECLAGRNVPIECCLTSNIKCGSVISFADHHFKRLLDNECAVVLCTDDCGVFDSTLSNELYIAAKTFHLRKCDFYSLSMNAVYHSFASQDEKQKIKKWIDDYFNENDDYFTL